VNLIYKIWGIFSAEKLNKLRDSYFNKLCSDLIAERLHVKFCKYVLEVSRRSTNIAIAGVSYKDTGIYNFLVWIKVKYFKLHLSIPK
jgi:hypothetical protein